MSKKSEDKRRRKAHADRRRVRPSPATQSAGRQDTGLPSAQTMWRTMHLDFRVQEKLIETTLDVQPSLWKRDASKIRRIEQAADCAAVLDLAPGATGLADYAWLKRLREFGPSAAPEIVARLQSDWIRTHRNVRAGIQERFVGALRWCDDAGAEALTDCWDALDDYGRSLACVALGLLGAQPAADRLWAFFQNTQSASNTYWIGPLWGLIDLEDARAADALLDLVVAKRAFYELYGFLSRAGDQRAVLPLIAGMLDGPEQLRADAMWALTGISHRLGRDRLAEVLRSEEGVPKTPAETIETLVERFFLYSQEDVEKHFEVFYDRTASSLLIGVGRPEAAALM
jgi:hypothetical protein